MWVRNTLVDVPFVESVRMSTVILALIPNGLVLSIALTYALGAVRLLGKDMLVQQFNAVESLSNVDVLCTDKTGTLTSGVIKAEDLLALGADEARLARLLGAFAASTTDANRTIEALQAAYPSARLPVTHEAFFSSSRKWSGLAFADGEALGTYVLGAPEMLAPALRAGPEWQPQAEQWAARGLRVVLFAGRPEPVTFGDDDRPPELPPEMEALGLICFSDELRPGVQNTLDEFTEAGIEVKIISGDNPQTVVALATQAGLHAAARRSGGDAYCEAVMDDYGLRLADDERRAEDDAGAVPAGAGEPEPIVAVAGSELEGLTSDELADVAASASVFGRVTPDQKQDIVRSLRDRGRYVAMIGDGVNDVVALKQANVAVGMQGGSQAARGVSDLILMKDTFAPLPFAFKEGQRIINGMNDILRIFMVRILFKASIILVITAIGGFPFAPRQGALLSWVGAGIPAVVFAALAIPGPTPRLGLFRLLARFVLPTGLLMTVMATGVYLVYAIPARHHFVAAHPGVSSEAVVRMGQPQATTALTLFACFAAILLLLLAAPPGQWWAGGAVVRRDWRIAAVAGALIAFTLGCLAVPLGRTFFELYPLPWWQVFAILGLAVVWSLLCRLIWRSRVLDAWLGTAEDPGNLCAKGLAKGPARRPV